jgi:hypothetical protein
MAKLIANRLQPYINKITSLTQTTFIKGRSIADNTIIMREIIHSFQMPEYRVKLFALKVVITEVFDTVK